MRTANAIDFWRGIALVMIFIDHIPGNSYTWWTLQNFAISDAAELFVFLAGWSLSLATGGPHRPEPWRHTFLRLISRAIQLYRAQLVVTAIALALLAATALLRNNPLYIEWNNAGAAFFDPIKATIGWVILTHQLHFVDILPMYVVLLLIAPFQIVLARRYRRATLATSFAIYIGALSWPLNFPSWPVEGGWFFNPLCWQFLLLLGFVSAELSRSWPGFQPLVNAVRWPAALVVAIGLAVKYVGYAPDPLAVPSPRYLFLFDKTYLSPVRLISLLALVITFHRLFGIIADPLGPCRDYLCGLGRNSLPVFCIGSLLSLCGQIIHFIAGGNLTTDTIVVIIGILGMGLTAWFVEWRARAKGLSRPR